MNIGNLKLFALLFSVSAMLGCKSYIPQLNSELKTKAENGDAEAQFEMGKTYPYFHYLSLKKIAEAEKWLLMASNQGYDKATYLLTQQRLSKYECPIEITRKLALEGFSEPQYSLGATYLTEGNNTPKDLSVAYKWMLLSAKDEYDRYTRAWNLINHYGISHLEISKGQKMAKEHFEKYGMSKSIYD